MLRVLSIISSSVRRKATAAIAHARRGPKGRKLRQRLLAWLPALPWTATMVLVLGCAPASHPRGTTPLPTREELLGNQSGGVVASQSATVASGQLPIRYLVNSPSYVSVIDVATRQTIASATAPAGTLVSIDVPSGILVGKKRLQSQPLTATRTYAVELQPLPTSTRAAPAPLTTQPTTGPAARSARQIMQQQQRPAPSLSPPSN
jgi:hypothetical protein